jgi:hypothetical protein
LVPEANLLLWGTCLNTNTQVSEEECLEEISQELEEVILEVLEEGLILILTVSLVILHTERIVKEDKEVLVHQVVEWQKEL